jgi:hypothetical protein
MGPDTSGTFQFKMGLPSFIFQLATLPVHADPAAPNPSVRRDPRFPCRWLTQPPRDSVAVRPRHANVKENHVRHGLRIGFEDRG